MDLKESTMTNKLWVFFAIIGGLPACQVFSGGQILDVDLRIPVIGAATAVGYLLGYSISSATGIKPGYFLAAEAASYGVVEETISLEGLSKKEQEYYASLTEK